MKSRRPSPPPGLEGVLVESAGETFVVLSFPTREASLPASLSEAEREIVVGVLAGKRAREIAEARGVSKRTVENQLQRVYRKMGVRSRAELAAKVHR